MQEFTVRFQVDGTFIATVKAKNPEQARDLAQKKLDVQWQKLLQSNRSEIELDEATPYEVTNADGEVVWE